MDVQAEAILKMLSEQFPRAEMHRVFDDLDARRMPWGTFRSLVWHKMPKAVAERIAGRRWELVEGDLRHNAAKMSVIYTMHCFYQRAAAGRPQEGSRHKGANLWTWGSKAG